MLLLELSTPQYRGQGPALHLDVSTWTTVTCAAPIEVATPQEHELQMDVSTLEWPVLILKMFFVCFLFASTFLFSK
jgi:hypothetical protein